MKFQQAFAPGREGFSEAAGAWAVEQKENKNKKLQHLVDYVMQQILEYNKYGFEIIGIVGANRSPNCGVDTTSDYNAEIKGKGLFMSELSGCLTKACLSIPMIGLKGTDNFVEKITTLL